MKYLILLAASAVALLLAWLAWGPSAAPSAAPRLPAADAKHERPHAPIRLYLPLDSRDQGAWVESAQQLWNSGAMRHHAPEFVRLIALVGQSLEEEYWRALSPGVFSAWETLRKRPEGKEALKPIQKDLFDRFVGSGRLETVERLARLVQAGDPDAAGIDEAFARAVDSVLPGGVYADSPPALAIAARLRARDYGKARQALETLVAREELSDDSKAAPRAALAALVLFQKAKAGPPAMADVVGAWSGIPEGALGRDLLTGDVLRTMLEEVAIDAVRGSGPTYAAVEGFVGDSAGRQGAADYWRRVLRVLMVHGREAPLERTRLVDALVKACAAKFPLDSGEIWVEMAERTEGKIEHYTLRADYLERAVMATPSGDRRPVLIKRAVEEHLKVGEFERGRQLLARLRNPAAPVEELQLLDKLGEELAKRETADRDRVARQTREIEIGKHRAQLKYMQERLAEAKKQGRSPEDIASIEKVVKELEKKSEE